MKTSTGLVGGATIEDVQLMRQTVGNDMGIKATGGIRTLIDALAMIRLEPTESEQAPQQP